MRLIEDDGRRIRGKGGRVPRKMCLPSVEGLIFTVHRPPYFHRLRSVFGHEDNNSNFNSSQKKSRLWFFPIQPLRRLDSTRVVDAFALEWCDQSWRSVSRSPRSRYASRGSKVNLPVTGDDSSIVGSARLAPRSSRVRPRVLPLRHLPVTRNNNLPETTGNDDRARTIQGHRKRRNRSASITR